MPSYVITGANRGLGLAFLKVLSEDPSNVLFGLVRNKPAAEERLAKEGIRGVTILQADITDTPALKAAAKEVANVTGGKLNYLINNAALVSDNTTFNSALDYTEDSAELEDSIDYSIKVNVNGVIKTLTAFLPLILASNGPKKVITLTTGLAELDLTNELSLPISIAYSTSKAALNMVIAKYQAAYLNHGILFLSISPGVVATSETPQEFPKGVQEMMQKFMEYAPEWKGPLEPVESAKLVLKVADNASFKNGDGAKTLSHWGNKRWL